MNRKERMAFKRFLKSIKDDSIDITYAPTESPGEFEVTYNAGRFNETFYVHVTDEQWDEIDGNEVMALLKKLKNLIHELSETDKVSLKIKEIEDVLDARDLSELFGAETYNGWLYDEEFEGKTHEESIVTTAFYCIAKCTVFLNYKISK